MKDQPVDFVSVVLMWATVVLFLAMIIYKLGQIEKALTP